MHIDKIHQEEALGTGLTILREREDIYTVADLDICTGIAGSPAAFTVLASAYGVPVGSNIDMLDGEIGFLIKIVP